MRAVSLSIGSLASLTGLVFPFVLARQATGLNQMILLLMMAGIASSFIYGAGFAPLQKSLRVLISPWLSWPVVVVCLGGLLALR